MTIQFLLTAFVVVIAPGTGVLYTIAVGLGQGRSASLAAALGCTLGIVPALLAATLGLAAVLHTSAVLFTTLKMAGVAYLLWLAWQMLREGGALNIQANKTKISHWQTAKRGCLINVLNPKLSVFFMALLPPFLSGNAATATQEIIILGGTFMAMTLAVFLAYGIFAARARDWILGSQALMTWLNRTFAAVFLALAGKLALERA